MVKAVWIIFPVILQTVVNLRMLSIGGQKEIFLHDYETISTLPLMSGTKESNIVFIFFDLYHFGRPVAETFLLRKHQFMCRILQHANIYNINQYYQVSNDHNS